MARFFSFVFFFLFVVPVMYVVMCLCACAIFLFLPLVYQKEKLGFLVLSFFLLINCWSSIVASIVFAIVVQISTFFFELGCACEDEKGYRVRSVHRHREKKTPCEAVSTYACVL